MSDNLRKALENQPAIAERLAKGQKFTAYEVGDDGRWAFGIGPVTDFLGIGTCANEGVAEWMRRFMLAALASTPASSPHREAGQFAADVERQAILDGLYEVRANYDEEESDFANLDAAIEFINSVSASSPAVTEEMVEKGAKVLAERGYAEGVKLVATLSAGVVSAKWHPKPEEYDPANYMDDARACLTAALAPEERKT
jgi:hypothetical protein